MRKSNSPQKSETLKSELSRIRHESLLATRQNDYRKIAQLTVQAAELNKTLRAMESVE